MACFNARMKDLAREIEIRPWIFLGATAKPLYITIYPPLYTYGFKEKFGQEAEIVYASENNRAHWYMRGDQLDALAEIMLPRLLEDSWGWYDQCVRELDEFQKFNQRFLKTSLAELDDIALPEFMREYSRIFREPFTTNNVLEALSYYFQHALKAMLREEGVTSDRADTLLEEYGQPARPNYVKECAEQYRRAKNDTEREAVRRKYYYIFNDYMGPVEVTHEALQKLAESTPYEFARQATTQDVSTKAQALLTAFQVTTTIQDIRKAELLEMVTAASRFGREFAHRSMTPYEDIEYATWEELEGGAWKLEDLRARRRSPFVMYWTLEGTQIHQGEKARALIELSHTHILKADSEATEIRGACASKGKVTGRAVVVFEPREFERVREGDILFTIMTRPEFLPVMHRAAAFICDEGGLTSHAAIVAREMKKPCVIATKVGTRTFKDGDMVEVDADNGVVKKI